MRGGKRLATRGDAVSFHSERFIVSILFILLFGVGGCASSPKWWPGSEYCVFQAETGRPEPDVLIAFEDKRTGRMIYARTNEKGLARLENIPRDGWRSLKEFEVRVGKKGFAPAELCDNPPGELRQRPELRNCVFYCIVPAGTDRRKIREHEHARRDIFEGAGQTQEELRAEWEAYLRDSAIAP